jgi:imidazole glycerol-phosphate synthase subunit HisH
MKKNVVILDYGIGNVKSIANALIEIGAEPVLSSDEKVIMDAEALILPGVGAFQKGMSNLIEANLVHVIQEYVATGKPFLGICLGMQMLLEESDEFGITKGLGLIPGKVQKLKLGEGSSEKLPHVSWNEIKEPQIGRWSNSLLESTEINTDVYFVHSFAAVPSISENILAVANYGNADFCAAVKKDNVTGVQFHPEKSGKLGLKMLNAWLYD